MAADQRRKRLNGESIVSYCSPEQYRTKRKNSGIVQSDLTMKSHVSVEWDSKHQRVVAKREQIGISWRRMRPFANLDHNGHKVLADVLPVPQEIFDLDSLSEVLSYEVWNTQLSDNERTLLMQFLPSGLQTHQVVEELLSGDNFHFGNPSVKWGASLCSGELHPDMIVNQEQHLKSDKRAYYSQLHNYHKDMIVFLIKLKERWGSCNDPEMEILPNIQSLKNDIEKRLPNLNEFRVNDKRNATRTSGSYSCGAEEKSYSDNHISSMRQGNELQRRVFGKNFNKGKPRHMMVSSDFKLNVGARPKKVGKLQKLDIHASDGDKYMSFIKISKKQHELVQSLKLSCKSIQASTLNHILGDLDNIHVQPYGLFVKEEQKKLHEYWLDLVNKDLPAAYANWTERRIQKHTMRNSLVLEMKDKSNVLVEDEDIVSTTVLAQDQEDGGVSDQSNLENYEDSIARFPENPSLHNSYQTSTDKLHHLSIDLEKNNLSKGDDTSQNITEHSRIMNSQDESISHRAPFSSDGHAWKAVEMSQSYYDSAVTHSYTVNSLSLVNPQVNEVKQTQMIGPESGLHLQDTSKGLLHSQSGNGPLSSYLSQDRINMIQSLIKGEGVNPYHREQKRAEVNFQASNNVNLGAGQFSSHLNGTLQTSLTSDQGQRRANEVYMPENISSSIYSDQGRYLIPRQDPLSAGSITDWDRAVNAPHTIGASQPHVNNGNFLGQQWYSSGLQVQGAWNGSDNGSLSSQSLRTGGNPDQNLFNVLSQCSQLRSGIPYQSVRQNDQFLAPRTYGIVDAGTHMMNAVAPQSSLPRDYFSGRDAPSALLPGDMTWMSLPPPNPALNGEMGNSYLRSWNR